MKLLCASLWPGKRASGGPIDRDQVKIVAIVVMYLDMKEGKVGSSLHYRIILPFHRKISYERNKAAGLLVVFSTAMRGIHPVIFASKDLCFFFNI